MEYETQKLPESLQHFVLTALCFDQRHGAMIAAQVSPEDFDGPWRDFARLVLRHRMRHRRPPRHYIVDIAAQTGNSIVKKRVLDIIADSEGFNAAPVAERVHIWRRRQTFKRAIVEATGVYSQYQEDQGSELADHATPIFQEALRTVYDTMDRGLRMTDPDALKFETREDWYRMGIPGLDRYRLGPAPGELLLYIGPKNSGKSWFCVHVSKMCVQQGAKVLYVSLEMSRRHVVERLFQSFHSIPTDGERIQYAKLKIDPHDNTLAGFTMKQWEPAKMHMDHPDVDKYIQRQMDKHRGLRYGNLIVRDFPTSQLTVESLGAWLDFMADAEDFIPNVVVMDYIDLMKVDSKTFRLDIGNNFEAMRGLAVERNFALVSPTQVNRVGMGAGAKVNKHTRSTMSAEDMRKVFISDICLTYSRTEDESARGLARLFVEHARNAPRGMMMVLAQAYARGQYVLDSAPMESGYMDQMRDIEKARSGESDEDE